MAVAYEYDMVGEGREDWRMKEMLSLSMKNEDVFEPNHFVI